jgi:hypothetical protein
MPKRTGAHFSRASESPISGRGPLFHRRYRTRIREASLNAPSLMLELNADDDV